MAERFVAFSEKDVDDFMEVEENANTKRKTETDITLVKLFIEKEK